MRIKNILRNSFFALFSQIILIFVGFFSQRVMNLRMGEALVGLNGVISNVISLLSVSELGISTAVVYHLYGAVKAYDEKEISGLMNIYRLAYRVFACVIVCLGLLVMPFLPMLIKESGFSTDYIRLVYLLWLIRTALSYLLSYRRSVLIADQKEYLVSIVNLAINGSNYLLCILILERWQNYILVLVINILVEAILNLYLSFYVEKKYPFLKVNRKEKPQQETITQMVYDVKNIFVSRIASKLLLSTDNVIISSCINTVSVGLYSNYSLITNSVLNIAVSVSGAMQPTIGHLFVDGDREKDYQALRQLTFVFFLGGSFASVCLYALITPFVSDIWLGEDFLLGMSETICFVANCGFCILILPLGLIMNVSGLFHREKFVSMAVAGVNLFVSLLLVRPLGMTGVMLGTLLAYCVQALMRVFYFFQEYLDRSCREYLMDLGQYVAVGILETLGIGTIGKVVYADGDAFHSMLLLLLCGLTPWVINWMLYRKSWRFQSIKVMILSLIKNNRRLSYETDYSNGCDSGVQNGKNS